jgi:serine/threonine-protein kinase
MSSVQAALSTALADRYRIDRELDGGGMARVFVATEVALGREVVVKVFPSAGIDPAGAERFEREIRTAARLQHPNIVPVLATGSTADLLWYTMPFVRGNSLRVALEQGQLTRADALRLLADVARALSYAHEAGVVHRDIKPENVLVANGIAVVTDFGIAKALDAARATQPGVTLTQAGAAIGTPAYMAPEQATGDPGLDGRADIYAWGILAYELLVGRHPFADRRTVHQLIVAHLTELPPSPETIDPSVASYAATVMQCIAKAPEARPADAMRLARELERLPVSEPVSIVVRPVAVLPAVAVLPFANLSSDPENEYLSDGLTDEILGTLGRTRGVRVAGRASCFALKGKQLDAKAIGQLLGVTAVVDGSVRRLGARVRVTAQLLDAESGFQLWSERYDRDTDDLFALQDELAAAITSALTTTLTTPQAPMVAAPKPVNPEAYSLYLQGYHLCRNQLAAANYDRAESLINRSIDIEPGFLKGHLARAMLFMHRGVYGFGQPRRLFSEARTSARAALAIDATSAEGWMIEAMCAYLIDRQWQEAERCAARAVQLDPGDAYIVARAAQLPLFRGRSEEALQMVRSALLLDPFSPAVKATCINSLRVLRQFAEAVAIARAGVEQSPDHPLFNFLLALCLRWAGRPEEAIPYGRRCVELAPESATAMQQRAIIALWDGDEEGYAYAMGRFEQWYREGRAVAQWAIGAAEARGDVDASIMWAERAEELGEYWFPYDLVDPWTDRFRSNPRFEALLDRIRGPHW